MGARRTAVEALTVDVPGRAVRVDEYLRGHPFAGGGQDSCGLGPSCLTAKTAAWVRLVRPSLSKMLET